MTFLELCQALVSKGAITGAIASVTGQTGEMARVVGWIGDAYRAIQNEHREWEFLRADISFDLAPGVSAISVPAGFGKWRFTDPWRAYMTGAGMIDEQDVVYCPYDHFRRTYLYGANRTMAGRPQVVTQRPDESLVIWPTPDALYTIEGDQFRAPRVMAANADVPGFATEYHMAIVFRALIDYAEYEGDASLFATATQNYNEVLAKMERRYLPEWNYPEPMA